jgi:hypothetical protein
MTAPDKSRKAFVSVVEMADMLDLSKSRFYVLMQAGIFPQPVRHEGCKRPVFDLESQQKCLEVRRTGIGANGQPILFNRKRRAVSPKPRRGREPVSGEHADLIEALKGLGLTANSEAVGRALAELYPTGWADMDLGEVVRQVFLFMQQKP